MQNAGPSAATGEATLPLAPTQKARPAEGPEDPVEVKRARRIAMACKDAGLDDEMRGDLIEWYTFGDSRSGKSLNEEQAGELFLIAQKIRTHKCDIRYDDNGKLFLEGDTTIKRGPRGS